MNYPSDKRFNCSSKLFMNLSVRSAIKKHNIKTRLATVLDDKYLQSSNACKAFKSVIVTQNNFETYEQIMKSNTLRNTNVLFKNYGEINNNGIDVDHADFCNTWESNRCDVFNRFKQEMYSERSLLRLTVCIRGMTNKRGKRKGMTLDKCIDKIVEELQENSYNYKIRPLTLKEWGMPLKANGFEPSEQGDCLAFTYGTMVNMIFLIEKL